MTRARKGEQPTVPEKILSVEDCKSLCRKHEAVLLCVATVYPLCKSPAATVLKDVGKAAKCERPKEVVERLRQALERIRETAEACVLKSFRGGGNKLIFVHEVCLPFACGVSMCNRLYILTVKSQIECKPTSGAAGNKERDLVLRISAVIEGGFTSVASGDAGGCSAQGGVF